MAKSKNNTPNMRCLEKLIIKRKSSVLQLKKLYFMFLKYKQTQPRCAQNERALYPGLVFKIVKTKRHRNRMFILVVIFIIIQ